MVSDRIGGSRRLESGSCFGLGTGNARGGVIQAPEDRPDVWNDEGEAIERAVTRSCTKQSAGPP